MRREEEQTARRARCIVPLRANSGDKVYGGKLKDLSLESTQTVTTLVFWDFSGSLAVGMGLKGLMATRISTLVVEPTGDLALTIS